MEALLEVIEGKNWEKGAKRDHKWQEEEEEEKRENIEALYEGLKILKQVEYESARRIRQIY